MKRFLTALALLLVLAAPSFALSDAEYLRMKKNSTTFAQADKRLSQVWNKLKKSLPKNVFASLQKDQRNWIASGRDVEAQNLMNEGYTRVAAYTMATNDRADLLPQLAESLRQGKTTPAPAKPQQKPEPVYEPTPPDDEEMESQPTNDPAGEYEGKGAFVTVKVIDYSSMEAEASFGRWKDEASWTARGWIDDNVLELSDADYINCTATITFSPDSLKVSISDTTDWAEVTADDFEMAGVYRKVR